MERPDIEPLNDAVKPTWVADEFTWFKHVDNRTIISDSGPPERWRIYLTPERGHSRSCRFVKRES